MNPPDDKAVMKNKEEFFLIAAHELRTPLTAIKASAELMLREYLDQLPNNNMKELLINIDAASARLIKIVNDFLEAPRLEEGHIEIHKETFDLMEIVRKVVGDLKILVTKKNITLSYEEPVSQLPNVFADKNITEQILINLIGNAIKFTYQGGITIRAMVEGDNVKVTVSDTGIGIAEHDQPILFRKFQQTDESFIARGIVQGTGLGLYISQLLISHMGGAITLEKSELGKGSVFSFTIPAAK